MKRIIIEIIIVIGVIVAIVALSARINYLNQELFIDLFGTSIF